MNAHDSTDISSQIPATSSDREVFDWIESVRIDHEVPVVHVYSGRFAAISAIEELR